MARPIHSAQALIEKIQSLPADRIAQVEDFVDLLREQAIARKTATSKESLDFPVDNPGPWPEELSLRREDMYGDDGR